MIAGTTRAALAAIDFWLSWSSDLADHVDILFALKVDFRREVLPPDLEAVLQDAEPGHEALCTLAAGAPVPDLDPGDIYRLATYRFEPMSRRPVRPKSHIGRFYPERLVTGGGPGMQARHGRNPTDFFDKSAFRRTDESDDAAFYAAPLMAPRIDGRAALVVQELHEVERLGAAGYYFLLPNRIFWLPTLGIRGLPRATADACYGRLAEADPVFAAWADKKG